MQKLRGIIESDTPISDKVSLWLQNLDLKKYDKGKWVSINNEGSSSEVLDKVDKLFYSSSDSIAIQSNQDEDGYYLMLNSKDIIDIPAVGIMTIEEGDFTGSITQIAAPYIDEEGAVTSGSAIFIDPYHLYLQQITNNSEIALIGENIKIGLDPEDPANYITSNELIGLKSSIPEYGIIDDTSYTIQDGTETSIPNTSIKGTYTLMNGLCHIECNAKVLKDYKMMLYKLPVADLKYEDLNVKIKLIMYSDAENPENIIDMCGYIYFIGTEYFYLIPPIFKIDNEGTPIFSKDAECFISLTYKYK